MSRRIRWARFDRSKRRECRSCPRYAKGRFVPPDLVSECGLGGLAEAPGEREADAGRNLIGPAGRVWDRLLSEASGVGRDQCATVNSVMCFMAGNPKPTEEELEACSGLVEAALDEAQDRGGVRVWILLGAIALKRMTGDRSIMAWRGSVIRTGKKVLLSAKRKKTVLGPERFKSGDRKGELKPRKLPWTLDVRGGRLTVATLHPAELMYSGFDSWTYAVVDHRRALRLAAGRTLIELGRHIDTSPTPEKICEALGQTRRLVIDVEAQRESGTMTLIGIGLDEQTALVGPPAMILEGLGRWADDDSRATVIMHNVGYDLRKLREAGLDLRRPHVAFHDTMHGAAYERPDLPARFQPRALDTALSRDGGLRFYNWKAAFREGRDLDEAHYCGLDCCGEMRLANSQDRNFEKTGRHRFFHETMMPLLPILLEMEDEGIAGDLDRQARLRRGQREAVRKLERMWAKEVGDVDYNSPKQMQEFLFGVRGLKPVKRTSKGAPSTDRESLDRLRARYPDEPALRLLRDVKHAGKILSTYLKPQLFGEDGRAHFRYDLTGTWTGRLSSDGQQIPRPSKDGRGGCTEGVKGCRCGRLRSMFIADDGDLGLAVADFSQIENRITALLAGETWLLEAYDDPDFDEYVNLAEFISERLGRPFSRQEAKPVKLGSNYLLGVPGISRLLKCDKATAAVIYESIRAAYPKVSTWRDRLIREAGRRGWIANPFGRRAYFRAIRKYGQVTVDGPAVVAFVPQSTAQGVIFKAMLRAREEGLKIRMQVHDELVVSMAYEDDGEILKEVMEEGVGELGGWSCPVDLGVGRSWEEGKKDG